MVTSEFCGVCGETRPFDKPKLNHLLHLALTVVTLGLWSLVWLVLAVIHAGKQRRCRVCGTLLLAARAEALAKRAP